MNLRSSIVVVLTLSAAVLFAVLDLKALWRSNTSLKEQATILRENAEEIGTLLSQPRPATNTGEVSESELLRLRGKISRINQELAELGLLNQSNANAPSATLRREELAREANNRFQLRTQVELTQLSALQQQLALAVSQNQAFAFIDDSDGRPSSALTNLVPSLKWDELEILCHDTPSFELLRLYHPDEIVARFLRATLDPAGVPYRTAISADGRTFSEPEQDLLNRMNHTSAKTSSSETLMQEVRKFTSGHR
jgi:hypothetical protein